MFAWAILKHNGFFVYACVQTFKVSSHCGLHCLLLYA